MSQINVNTVNEYASANGVTVDGVLIKDGGIASTFITGLTSGLSSAQIFRLTTNTNNTTFLKLWEAPDNTPAQGSIGSVVSVDTSTGYFSFSETGKYLVTSSILMFYHGNSTISQQIIFSDDDYAVYAAKAGKESIVISVRGEQPKILRTVEYKLVGEFKTTNGRKTFIVTEWEKLSGRVNYAKSLPKLNF